MAACPKILVVDDNEAMRYSAVRHLRGAGFEVIEASSGNDALRAIDDSPDLVLLDLKLPDISGFEVCRRLKSDSRTRAIPVVQISASFVEQEVRDLSVGCGADAFIAQPVSKQELLATVSGLLRTTREQPAARPQPQIRDEDLRQVLHALGEKNRTLSAILDASPVAILALDAEDCITLWNPAAERIFGWTQDEVIGRPVPFASPDQKEEVDVIRETMARNGQIIRRQASRRSKDGRSIDVILSSAPLLDVDGKIRGRVVVIEDVTLQHQAQSLLLRNEKLIATGRMAATLAHEINNPLASLTNLMYLLRVDAGIPEGARKFVDLASEEVARVARITRQMLSVHREAEAPVQLFLSDILDSVLDLHSPSARDMGVAVVRDYREQTAVLGYPGEMRQAFSNLVANALFATPAKGRLIVRIRRTRQWHTGAVGTTVVIADTGCGIPQEVRCRIFEPFFTSKGEKGTGLGLWVVRQVVERFGGRIAFRTCVGPSRSGTCFSIFFPADFSSSSDVVHPEHVHRV